MPAPSKKKNREESKTIEELSLLSAINSEYNLMHPMLDAKYVRVRNPLTGKDPSFETDTDAFRELIAQLCDKGLGKKLAKEFDFFIQEIDKKWLNVKEFVIPKEYF